MNMLRIKMAAFAFFFYLAINWFVIYVSDLIHAKNWGELVISPLMLMAVGYPVWMLFENDLKNNK